MIMRVVLVLDVVLERPGKAIIGKPFGKFNDCDEESRPWELIRDMAQCGPLLLCRLIASGLEGR
jgi:hypothetical protein